MNNEENREKKKLTLKERLKDKREKAKIELILYGIFFLGVIVFVRVLGSNGNTTNIDSNNLVEDSFVSLLKDNYEYYTVVTIDDNKYEYYGLVLGNNSTINLKVDEEIKSYHLMNNKYYVLIDENYILTDEKEIYPYIDYRYLSISNIKRYLDLSIRENDRYKVRISDVVMGSTSEEYIVIYINEGDKNIVIDYSELFKLTDDSIENVVVNITYSNINNIISLGE